MNIIGKYQLLIIISTFFLIATSAVLFWGFDKGCDITDEGFCLLGYQNYQQAKVYVSSFLLIGDKTFAGADAGVFQLRMDKLLFTLGGSLFLALGVSLWLGQIYGLRKRHLYILNAVFLGSVSLLNFSVLYTVVSYNDMINLVLMITGGLYFMSRYFIMKDHHRIACFLTLLLGAVTGFAFFIKFSVSIIMMITYLILSWLIRGRGAAGKIGMIFSILLGYLLGWAGYFIFFQPAGEWFPVFSESMREWSTGHHNLKNIVKTNFYYTVLPFLRTLIFFLPFLLLGRIFSRRLLKADRRFNVHRLVFLLIFLAGIIICGLYRARSLQPELYTGFYVFFYILLLMTLALGQNLGSGDVNKEHLLLAILLFLLPLIGATGTNNPVSVNLVLHLTSWFVLLVWMMLKIEIKSGLNLQIFTILAVLMVFSQVMDGYVFHPYRIKGSRLQQNMTLGEGIRESRLKLDSATHDFICSTAVSLQKAGFRKGDDIIALYGMPGLVYLVGGKSPTFPWIEDGFLNLSCYYLNSYNKEKRLFYLIKNDYFPEFYDCLRQKGYNLENGIEFEEMIDHPLNERVVKIVADRNYQDVEKD